MVILDRKIVHNVQTTCSHITYTEFNLPFHRHSEIHLTPNEYRQHINAEKNQQPYEYNNWFAARLNT